MFDIFWISMYWIQVLQVLGLETNCFTATTFRK